MKIKDNIHGFGQLVAFEESHPDFFKHSDTEYRIYIACQSVAEFMEKLPMLPDPKIRKSREFLIADQFFGPGVKVQLYIAFAKCGSFQAASTELQNVIDAAAEDAP